MCISVVLRYIASSNVAEYCRIVILTASSLLACNVATVEPLDLAYILMAIRTVDLDEHDATSLCNDIVFVMDSHTSMSVRMMCCESIAHFGAKSSIYKDSFERLIVDLTIEIELRDENQRKLSGNLRIINTPAI